MSPTELEARQWQAAVDAVRGKRDDIDFRLIPRDEVGKLRIRLEMMPWTKTADWLALTGEPQVKILLHCTTAEWVEMLAQGSK